MEESASHQEWELSKENIQPLRSGRKAAKLATIAQPTDPKKLAEERQEYENALRMYDGPDPLDPWYRYISWVEQEYPKGGKEGGLDKLLESCIKSIKDVKEANNDPRLCAIWLKYASMSAKPLEVFSFMFSNGVCTQRPEMFEAWTWHLESAKAFKKAESVFAKGIDAMTEQENKDRLGERKKQFQARVIRRLNGEEIPEEETEEEKRSALGQLRGHGKHAKVGSLRVGHAKLGGPGVLQQSGSGAKQPLRSHNSQAKAGAGFTIYSDENAPAGGVGGAGSGRHLPSREDRKENELAAGPWTKAKVVKKSQNVPLDSIAQYSKPAFQVYEEPSSASTQSSDRKFLPADSGVLATKKEEKSWTISCPLAQFEPPDPTKKPMYCKDKVYQGTTEFSFEELRALRWKERAKRAEEIIQIEQRKAELLEMEMKVKEQQEALQRQQQEMERKMAEAMERKMAEWQRMMESQSAASMVVQPRPGIAVTRPSVSEAEVEAAAAPPAVSRQPSLDTTATLLAANPLGGNRSLGSTAATPSPHGAKLTRELSQPSPTMNTREAMAAMAGLWSKPVGDDVFEDPQPLQNSGHAPAPPSFQIYTDAEGDSRTDTGATPFEIFCDTGSNSSSGASAGPAQPAATTTPFPIFCDENAAAPLKLPSVRVNRRSRSESLNRHEDKENSPPGTDDEDRENALPPGYSQPATGARKKTGILTEADNVKFIPLDVQEKVLDEDERQQLQLEQSPVPVFKSPKSKLKSVNKKADIPKPFGGNQTIMLPEEEDFERMAKMSSTPFTGKPSYQFEQDENTCAVNILYKPAPEPQQEPEQDSLCPPPASAGYGYGAGGYRMDTIVETSREYYKSSTSSSGGDTLHPGQEQTNRSHWGNTGHTLLHNSTAAASLARTPGQHLGGGTAGPSVTASSGYFGDKSNNVTKSGVKLDNKRELVASPQVAQNFEKRLKTRLEEPEEEECQFDEPTGMFGDMMAELKQNMSKNMNRAEAEESMQASFIDQDQESSRMEIPPTPTLLQRSHLAPRLDCTAGLAINTTAAPQLDMTGLGGGAPRLDLTGAPRLDITGAPRLDITGAPRLDLTAAPRLDLTGAPRLDITGAPSLDLTGAPRLDITEAPRLDITAAPSLDMTAEDGGLAQRTANLSLDDTIDPFHPDTHAALLASLATPVSARHGYVAHQRSMPAIRARATVTLGQDSFYISELKGEGGNAKVFAATRHDDDMDCTIAGIDAVLKVQKPANDWEFYLCTEVQSRLAPGLRPAFMSVPRNYVFTDGGIFVSYHQKFGTLLDIVNIVKTCQVAKTSIEPMAVYFTIELLKMIEGLHDAGILHADLKADNLLLQSIPALSTEAKSAKEMFEDAPLCLQLIDFGRSIDLTLLPADAAFTKVVNTDGVMCTEMREGRAWRHHIDYFGVAAVAYCLLFQNYIEVVKVDQKWEVKGSFKRWWHADIWREFFGAMINIQGVEKEHLPSLAGWRTRFEEMFFKENMAKNLKTLTNDVLKELMKK